MAIALIAWLRAPAPITWTSTLPICRTTPASAPATELGLDREDTFRHSMAVPSFGERSSTSLLGRYAGFLPKTGSPPYRLPESLSTLPAVRPPSTPLRQPEGGHNTE